jgi:hypothetical protein
MAKTIPVVDRSDIETSRNAFGHINEGITGVDFRSVRKPFFRLPDSLEATPAYAVRRISSTRGLLE